MLEAMEMYRTPAAGEKVEKLDVQEVLGRTEKPFFEKLSSTRRAYVAARLGKDRSLARGETSSARITSRSRCAAAVVITGASRDRRGHRRAVRGARSESRVLSQATGEPGAAGTVQAP